MNNQELNQKLRKDSGSIDLEGKLISFLYILMRDHFSIGTIESIVRETELDGVGKNEYSNGWLALYAKNLSERLTNDL